MPILWYDTSVRLDYSRRFRRCNRIQSRLAANLRCFHLDALCIDSRLEVKTIQFDAFNAPTSVFGVANADNSCVRVDVLEPLAQLVNLIT
uniref:Uncharacterized protein n=1 Tax=uncultured marine group II/III euryarchaeote KM3_92_B07 TaxID=1456543 RepID=A0A075I1J6_9EURY|nr:hypothetical protein [uncultured marine group II/III euryarchaeote KM3_92_B07]